MSVILSVADYFMAKGWPVDVEDKRALDVGIEGEFMLSCWYSPKGGVELTFLWVRPGIRQDGDAQAMMSTLCKWADKERQVLRLWAWPFDGVKNPTGFCSYRLAAYYARAYGFAPVRWEWERRQRKIRMLRVP